MTGGATSLTFAHFGGAAAAFFPDMFNDSLGFLSMVVFPYVGKQTVCKGFHSSFCLCLLLLNVNGLMG